MTKQKAHAVQITTMSAELCNVTFLPKVLSLSVFTVFAVTLFGEILAIKA